MKILGDYAAFTATPAGRRGERVVQVNIGSVLRAHVTPTEARRIAAELIRAADAAQTRRRAKDAGSDPHSPAPDARSPVDRVLTATRASRAAQHASGPQQPTTNEDTTTRTTERSPS